MPWLLWLWSDETGALSLGSEGVTTLVTFIPREHVNLWDVSRAPKERPEFLKRCASENQALKP